MQSLRFDTHSWEVTVLSDVVADPPTWHHGLVARYWAEAHEPPDEGEISFFRTAIERFGQPALDLGCGAGRILLPLLRAGLEVDGCDISPDMIEWARKAASAEAFSPRLYVQRMQHLDLPQTYTTIFMCGAFGIAGGDGRALERAYHHLRPGGALVTDCFMPYHESPLRWSYWTPERRAELPLPWPESGERVRLPDGDELELVSRLVEVNPLDQYEVMQMRSRLWHLGEIVREEEAEIRVNIYFKNEMVLMLRTAGFSEVEIYRAPRYEPATVDTGVLGIVAIK